MPSNGKNPQQFRWKNDMVDDLISCLENFIASIDFKDKHFDDDRHAQYLVLRKELCKRTMRVWGHEILPKFQMALILLI